MLHRKARPKRKRLLSNFSNGSNVTTESKDCSNNNLYKVLSKLSSLLLDIKYTSINNKFNNKLGLTLLNSIPVLSIFVLLGIIGYNVGLFNTRLGFGIPFIEPDGLVQAAESAGNNTSLIIDNGTASDSIVTARNGVAYSSHTVQVKADNITGYALSITGPTNLSNGSTTISGAGGKTGSTMNDNTWGYGWNTTSTADANMTYNSFTGSAQTLSGDSVSNNSVNFTRKLIFAAKFDQNAVEGHYRAGVTLNLTITPKQQTANELIYMQDMTADACGSLESGTPKALIDIRDNNTYIIQKLSDGNCWMTQNLKLDLSVANIATVAGSDNLSASYPSSGLPASNSNFITSNTSSTYTYPQWAFSPAVSSSSPGDNQGYQTAYGYYYSWCAATAQTCTNGGDASGSICPKGWKLPKGGTTIADNNALSQTGNDFANLVMGDGKTLSSLSASTSIPGYTLSSATPKYIILGNANWYATGYIGDGLINPGSIVQYWSRTAVDYRYAYSLLFFSSDRKLYPANSTYRYNGFPVRCVAYSS